MKCQYCGFEFKEERDPNFPKLVEVTPGVLQGVLNCPRCEEMVSIATVNTRGLKSLNFKTSAD